MSDAVKSIRALARGLDVLQLLQARGSATLHALHQETGLPKATLLRILRTLREGGMIWQRMADDAYLPSYSLVELAGRMNREFALVEVASPLLEQLSARIKWPSVLAVPRLTHMEVIETNASRAYFDQIPLGPVGFRVSMLRSASGRAFLTFCEAPVREAILDSLRRSDHPGDRGARDPAYLARLLQETGQQGYGLRDPDFGGDFNRGRAEIDDGRESLAVPIRAGDHVLGTLNITWARRVHGRERGAALFAGPVAEAAAEVGARLVARV